MKQAQIKQLSKADCKRMQKQSMFNEFMAMVQMEFDDMPSDMQNTFNEAMASFLAGKLHIGRRNAIEAWNNGLGIG